MGPGGDEVEKRVDAVDANGGGPCEIAELDVAFFDKISSFGASSSPWSWMRSSSRRTISSTRIRLRSSPAARGLEGESGLRLASRGHLVTSLWLRSRLEGVTGGVGMTFAGCHGSGAVGGEELRLETDALRPPLANGGARSALNIEDTLSSTLCWRMSQHIATLQGSTQTLRQEEQKKERLLT